MPDKPEGDEASTRTPDAPWEPDGTVPARRPGGPSAPDLEVTSDVSRYSLGDEVARGGLGRIALGYDHRLHRPVAIKELLLRDGELDERFAREALLTARLQHPAIVPVYDAARWASGDPFYAMKLVDGRSLADAIRGARSLAERFALLPNVIAVAEAVAYAHSQGVIHRDLKPSNVLVGNFGETVVIDWGLAKELRVPEAAARAAARPAIPELTAVGSVMGTPGYMAPEQAAGKEVDERADVFALGGILYHVLTGDPPYRRADGDPIAQTLAGPPVAVERREPGVPRDLATIVKKAMAHDGAGRYLSARELAEELRRFQTGQLVRAHHYSAAVRLARWLRRHRVTVAVAAVLLGLLAALAIVSVGRIVRERNEARAQREEAGRQRDRAETRANELRLSRARAALDGDPTAAVAWLKTHAVTPATRTAARDLLAEAQSRGVARHVSTFAAGVRALAVTPDGRTLVAGHGDGALSIIDTATGARRTLAAGGGEVIHELAVSDRAALSIGVDGALRVWDLDGAAPRILGGHEGRAHLAVLPGRRVATAGTDGTVRIWDQGGGPAQVLLTGAGTVRVLAASPDGALLVAGTFEGEVLSLATAGGGRRTLARGATPIEAVAIAPDGTVLAAESGGAIHVVGARTRLWRPDDQGVLAMALSPDGTTLAVGSLDGTLRAWDVAAGTAEVLRGGERNVTALAWSPDGQQLCAVTVEGTVRLWSPARATVMALRGHNGADACVFSPDGRWLATGGHDQTVRLWPVPATAQRVLGGDGSRITQLAFSADGGILAGSTRKGNVWVWEAAAGAGRVAHTGGLEARCVAVSPDGTRVASGGAAGGQLRVTTLAGASTRTVDEHALPITACAFAPDGQSLASADEGGAVHVRDVGSGRLRLDGTAGGYVPRLAFSPDGAWLAAGAIRVTLFPLGGGAPQVLEGHGDTVWRLAFSPDGAWLATASEDRTVRLWRLATGASAALSHRDWAFDVAFSPDSRLLASSSWDQTVRLWDVAGGGLRRELGAHLDQVYDVAFSPDGRLVASAGNDGCVRLWDVEDGAAGMLRHPTPVKRVLFAPDGRHLASAGEDGVVRLWDLPARGEATDPAGLERRAAEATSAVIGAGERPATP